MAISLLLGPREPLTCMIHQSKIFAPSTTKFFLPGPNLSQVILLWTGYGRRVPNNFDDKQYKSMNQKSLHIIKLNWLIQQYQYLAEHSKIHLISFWPYAHFLLELGRQKDRCGLFLYLITHVLEAVYQMYWVGLNRSNLY